MAVKRQKNREKKGVLKENLQRVVLALLIATLALLIKGGVRRENGSPVAGQVSSTPG